MRKWRKNEEMDREICAYAQNRERAETVSERVTEKMEALAKQLNRDLKDSIYMPKSENMVLFPLD